ELLLDAGANPNAFDERQVGPLQLAIMAGHDTEVVARLLEAGADPDTGNEGDESSMLSPLASAAATGNLELVELLLAHGAGIDGPAVSGHQGITPLYTAAMSGSVEVVDLLLDRGADPDGGFGHGAGIGPLYAAVVADEVDIVRRLLAAGADPAGAAPGGNVRLFTQNEEIIRLLTR